MAVMLNLLDGAEPGSEPSCALVPRTAALTQHLRLGVPHDQLSQPSSGWQFGHFSSLAAPAVHDQSVAMVELTGFEPALT